jgi:hypothetical protein
MERRRALGLGDIKMQGFCCPWPKVCKISPRVIPYYHTFEQAEK